MTSSVLWSGFCPVIVVTAQSSNPLAVFYTVTQTELYNICLARAKEKWKNSSAPPSEPESEGLLANRHDGFTAAFTPCSSPPVSFCLMYFRRWLFWPGIESGADQAGHLANLSQPVHLPAGQWNDTLTLEPNRFELQVELDFFSNCVSTLCLCSWSGRTVSRCAAQHSGSVHLLPARRWLRKSHTLMNRIRHCHNYCQTWQFWYWE